MAILRNLTKNVCEISKDTPENIHNSWKTQTLRKKIVVMTENFLEN